MKPEKQGKTKSRNSSELLNKYIRLLYISAGVVVLICCLVGIFAPSYLNNLPQKLLKKEIPLKIVEKNEYPDKLNKLLEIADLELKSYKKGDEAKYNNMFYLPKDSAWCAAFVSYLALKSDNSDIIPYSPRCNEQMSYFNDSKRLYFTSELKDDKVRVNELKNTILKDMKSARLFDSEKVKPINTTQFTDPKPGMLVYYHFGNGSSRYIDHVATVVEIEKDAEDNVTNFITIEGNFGDSLILRRVEMSDPSVLLFANPDYEESDSQSAMIVTNYNNQVNIKK